jgi:hypothetical protein
MAEWWENIGANLNQMAAGLLPITGRQNRADFARDAIFSTSALGRASGGPYAALARGITRDPLESRRPRTDNSAIDAAYQRQMRDVASLGGRSTLQSLIGQELAGQAPEMDPITYAGMTQEELLAYLLGGGGGPDLSGYNAMLEDITGREGALGTRKAEQQAFLTSLYDAAESRAEADRTALAAAVEAQLTSDAERRAAEMGVVRQGDVNRAASATAAREALGAPTGPDLTSNVVENVASGVAAGGAIADRDARIRESIANQQLTREISSLTPMEQMAVMGLNRQYEDRLAGLASERAAIQAQMAAARSASRGPSVSEKIGAMQFAGDVFAPAAGPEIAIPDLLQTAQGIQSYFGPSAPEVLGVANRILSETGVSRIDPTGEMSAQEALTRLRSSDPAIASLLNEFPEAAGIIVNYVVQANKG